MQSNCAHRVVTACTCLCKGNEDNFFAEAGCSLSWSLSVHFMKLDSMEARLWPVSSTWGNAGLYSPSCLHCLFSVSSLCGVVWLSVSWLSAADRCFVFSKTNFDVGRSRTWPGQTRVVGWFTLRDSKNKIPYIHWTSPVMCLLSSSDISYHLPCF